MHDLLNITNNPQIAQFFGLWMLGAVTYLFREIPAKIYDLIKSQVVITLTIEADTYENTIIYGNFLNWVNKHLVASLSKSVSLQSINDNDVTGPGYGVHFFTFKNCLYWFSVIKLDSAGSDKQKKQLTISAFGLDSRRFRDLADKILSFRLSDKLTVSTWSKSGWWDSDGILTPRDINSVFITNGSKELIINAVNDFIDNEEWFKTRGISYKLSVMLHGVPGCGKTSLIKAMANHLSKNVYILSLSQLSDTGLDDALSKVKKGSFILIEDFDSVSVVKNRVNKSGEDLTTSLADAVSGLTLSGVLNAIDGISTPQGIIIFYTTNHIEHIDPAFIRPGRCDVSVEIGLLSEIEVGDYYRFVYADNNLALPRDFKIQIAGCKLEQILRANMFNPEGFLEDLLTLS